MAKKKRPLDPTFHGRWHIDSKCVIPGGSYVIIRSEGEHDEFPIYIVYLVTSLYHGLRYIDLKAASSGFYTYAAAKEYVFNQQVEDKSKRCYTEISRHPLQSDFSR